MRISVSEAKGQLTDLVRRAEAGEEVCLTRHGHVVARIAPERSRPTAVEKRKILERIMGEARTKANPGPSAARSQDFLYDEYGLPK